MAEGKTISVGLIGPGLVGSELLRQISAEQTNLQKRHGLVIKIRAIARSQTMVLSHRDNPINLDIWDRDLAERAVPTNLELLADHLASCDSDIAVLCDCTASQVTSDSYLAWLQRGIHIATANKKANSGPLQYYRLMREAKGRLLYEANVGAGLPIISTIKDLLMTGDEVIEIQGVFSGTLSYIFNEFDCNKNLFSGVVKQAKEKGFTEPDPREDLSGIDVARKLVILAREVGLSVELQDISVKSLVPEELQDQSTVSTQQFMDQLPNHDRELSLRSQAANEYQQNIRYAGVVDVKKGTCSVELRQYDKAHPFSSLRGSDNIALLRTARYNSQPLVVQGPGAGATVTAAGVFADLLHLA